MAIGLAVEMAICVVVELAIWLAGACRRAGGSAGICAVNRAVHLAGRRCGCSPSAELAIWLPVELVVDLTGELVLLCRSSWLFA